MRMRGVVVGLGQLSPASDDVVDLGPVAVVDRPLPEELGLEVILVGGGWVVAQLGVLDDDVAHVDPKPRHAAVEPEPEDGVEFRPDLLVPPIEIRLLGKVVVQVELAGRRVERPGRPPEAAHPVVGGRRRRPWDRPRRTNRASRRRSEERESTNQGCCCAGVVRDDVEKHADVAVGRRRQPGGRRSPSSRDRVARRSSRQRRSPSRRWVRR